MSGRRESGASSMAVYIKGMEMPKNCECCEFAYWSNLKQANVCEMSDDAVLTRAMTFKDVTARPDFCPMTEVKEHGRLIDADAIIQQAQKYEDEGNTFCLDSAEELEFYLDDEAPTIIEGSEDDER